MMEPTKDHTNVSVNDSTDAEWAMNTKMFIEDNDSDQWKQRRAAPLSVVASRRHSDLTHPNNTVGTMGQTDETHTRIFASLVPDEVIYNIRDYSKRNFDACLLFGDVSGFTDLCEKYNKTGKGGPSRLTQVLNSYIGAMVQEILSHNGDVLKFSGDAFIAIWKVTDNLSMKDAVHEALDCSLVIQKTYGRYQADVDVVVRVKLSISSGAMTFSLLGNLENSHYFCFGPPIMDLKAAEACSTAGDIIITRSAWQHVSPNEYLAEEMKDGLHAKVFGVGPNWRNIQRNVAYNKEDTYSVLTATEAGKQGSLASADDNDSSVTMISAGIERRSSTVSTASQVFAAADQYALRPAVNYAVRSRMKDELRKFIISPVERGILADEPIEYLTEIRQITVLFINCKVSYNIDPTRCIDIANNVYISICRLVKDRHGCLNKVNMFDKDLMLLVIFGLRGLKHEMESQIALQCATECYETLSKIANVNGVAVGVTTGKTYCGAFGHALRREYTVISLIVNKAARLMVAYPNKVTCDRETFLHSKLEARNFILQEYKHLKGIVNPGPIYEFKEVVKTRDVALTVSSKPLLGREQELDLYMHLLGVAKEVSKKNRGDDEYYNMIVIQGESRQGKTRLLEEMVYCADDDIPISRFALTKTDLDTPYTTIQLIFNPMLRLQEKATQAEREKRIFSRMKNEHTRDQLCYLNDIFNVNFPRTANFTNLSKNQKYKELKTVFTIFSQKCFIKYWVIAIDDAENIDDESWVLTSILLKLNLVFLVASMGLRSYISQIAADVLKQPKIKIIQLKSIDKWFHVGLACQMLDVEAIPPELEKVIQSRSNGNPGWVESFLISLLQSGGLYIKEITRKLAYESGLVVPPLYMIMRLTEEEIGLWEKIMEERSESDPADRWKMYIDCCRESFPDLTVAQSLNEKFELFSAIHVCVLNPNFNIDDVDPELSKDVLILKIFDSVTSYEQLLLKCSAILGDIFPRDMLMYIMSSSAVRLTALAVKKLFEIHVLSCARGNFIEGGLIFKERLVNPDEDMRVVCECVGLVIEENCEDLPRYASCGYLRFRSSNFRETTYNLLTENQKREFHSRAIRYLEKETRKCRACGNGYFSRYIGVKQDEDLRRRKSRRKKKKSPGSITTETSSFYTAVENPNNPMSRRYSAFSGGSGASGASKSYGRDYSMGMSMFSSSAGHSGQSHFSIGSSLGRTDSDSSADTRLTTGRFGYGTIRKYKNDFNLTKTFSDTDYSHCTCPLILNTMYTQMIEHCSGAGLLEKMMNAMIEYAYVCIEIQNAPQAIKILEEALQLVDGPMKEQVELDWMIELRRGKIFTVLGFAKLSLSQIEEAYTYLQAALHCYGVKFPEKRLGQFVCKLNHKLKEYFALYIYPEAFTRTTCDDDVAEYCNNVSECLSYLCTYFMIKRQWNKANIASLWSINKALETESDFQKICNAYANIISVGSHFGNHNLNVGLEVFAFKICNAKRSTLELEELKAVANLYYSIFIARIQRSEIEKGIHIGYILWRLGSSTHSPIILLNVLPVLMCLILQSMHVIEAGNMFQEMLQLTSEDTDNTSKSWYYASCLIFHLETGLTVETYQKCLAFIQGEGQELTLRDPEAKKRLVTVIWLWNIRNENWEGAIIWQEEAWSFFKQEKRQDITDSSMTTALYLLQGMIIYMVGKMDRKNMKAADMADDRIKTLFKFLTKALKISLIIKPRLYHLKAYYKVCKDNDYLTAFKLLKEASKLATKLENHLEASWINHSHEAWSNKLTRAEKDFWRIHSEDDNYIDYQDYDEIGEDRFGHFTLPIPKYL